MTTLRHAEPFHLTPVRLQRWPLARPTIKCVVLLGVAIPGPGWCAGLGVRLVAGPVSKRVPGWRNLGSRASRGSPDLRGVPGFSGPRFREICAFGASTSGSTGRGLNGTPPAAPPARRRRRSGSCENDAGSTLIATSRPRRGSFARKAEILPDDSSRFVRAATGRRGVDLVRGQETELDARLGRVTEKALPGIGPGFLHLSLARRDCRGARVLKLSESLSDNCRGQSRTDVNSENEKPPFFAGFSLLGKREWWRRRELNPRPISRHQKVNPARAKEVPGCESPDFRST